MLLFASIARDRAWRIPNNAAQRMCSEFVQGNMKSGICVEPVRERENRIRPINWTRLPVNFSVQLFVYETKFAGDVVESLLYMGIVKVLFGLDGSHASIG